MKKLVAIGISILFASIAAAGEQSVNLTHPFADYNTVTVSSIATEEGNVLRAALVSNDAADRVLPDMCLPEGGDPSLLSVYTILLDKKYLVFTCKWAVIHVGLGIKGEEYKTFVYSEGVGNSQFNSERKLAAALSGYEGTVEEGGNEYFWYARQDIAKKKIAEVIKDLDTDSLDLIEMVILARLIDGDTMAISSYLRDDRVAALKKDHPISAKNYQAYNIIAISLFETGETSSALSMLNKIEIAAPESKAHTLALADSLWETDRAYSENYYTLYKALMKIQGQEDMLPTRVSERAGNLSGLPPGRKLIN